MYPQNESKFERTMYCFPITRYHSNQEAHFTFQSWTAVDSIFRCRSGFFSVASGADLSRILLACYATHTKKPLKAAELSGMIIEQKKCGYNDLPTIFLITLKLWFCITGSVAVRRRFVTMDCIATVHELKCSVTDSTYFGWYHPDYHEICSWRLSPDKKSFLTVYIDGKLQILNRIYAAFSQKFLP